MWPLSSFQTMLLKSLLLLIPLFCFCSCCPAAYLLAPFPLMFPAFFCCLFHFCRFQDTKKKLQEALIKITPVVLIIMFSSHSPCRMPWACCLRSWNAFCLSCSCRSVFSVYSVWWEQWFWFCYWFLIRKQFLLSFWKLHLPTPALENASRCSFGWERVTLGASQLLHSKCYVVVLSQKWIWSKAISSQIALSDMPLPLFDVKNEPFKAINRVFFFWTERLN